MFYVFMNHIFWYTSHTIYYMGLPMFWNLPDKTLEFEIAGLSVCLFLLMLLKELSY